MDPYRTPAPRADRTARAGDAAITVALAALVALSALRVVAAFVLGEVFGVEATLAFLVLLVAGAWGGLAALRVARASR
jgi:hypothetical protein